ncbi:S-adenosylmethionine:tRNA ribosyltransferase-isomerase [Marinilabilia salmonicolor]|uniref:S-adenosylmethionine:tRNA ribosyltransferase-isomerase n=1 Tax=Marinilabilia salmonicolor TaxID=989 RepID=UPI000B000B3A|nr:S-adenosylmethionine:tRNA ribosyltransferase-isomerase [Marinilabilia salmonicolor]
MHISIDQYKYRLPSEKIAKYPLKGRDQSKLLHFQHNTIDDKNFSELPDLIPADAMLLFNNTKVIRARLPFRKATGARIEIFCLEPASPTDVAMAFEQTKEVTWNCLVGNLKKWKEGDLEMDVDTGKVTVIVKAEKVSKTNDGYAIRFHWENPEYTFSELMEAMGKTLSLHIWNVSLKR